MNATKSNKVIGLNSIVTIYDFELEEKIVFHIVSVKSNTENNELVYDCILSQSLLEHTVGERITVKADTAYDVEILEVDNSNIQSTPTKTYRNTFFCFQGKQFAHELCGGYIFAGLDPSISHWNRLRSVKDGDIIFHGDMQGILAISIVKGKCFIAKRPPEHYLANDKKDMDGLMVKVKYQLLKTPIITSLYRKDIIRLQGQHEGKGYPFNKCGKGNQGYLFNLNMNLAKFFMEEIIKRNPFLLEKNYVQELLN